MAHLSHTYRSYDMKTREARPAAAKEKPAAAADGYDD
jgi:hypothetical protein